MFLCAVGYKSADDVVMTEQLLDIRFGVITNIDIINEREMAGGNVCNAFELKAFQEAVKVM